MMTQHAPKSTAPGVAFVFSCILLSPGISWAGTDPIAPPAPEPSQVLLAPEAPTYELRVSADGDGLLVLKVRYADDTFVSHAVGAFLRGTALPLELVFLDAFQPAPQAIRIPAALPAVSTETQSGETESGESETRAYDATAASEKPTAPLGQVKRKTLRSLARTLDFSPQAPFRVRVRQVPGFVEPAVFLGPRTAWQASAPRCLKEEWLAVARVHPAAASFDSAPVEFGALKLSLDALVAKTVGSTAPGGTSESGGTGAPLARTRPYFLFGEYVCVSFDDGPAPQPADRAR